MSELPEDRKAELDKAWKGRPKKLGDAIQFDALELIPIMGQVSRFSAGVEGWDEDFKMACAFTWLFPPIMPVRTIGYLFREK